MKNRLALQNKLEKLPQIQHKLVIAPQDILYLRTASIRGNTYIAGRYQADKMKFCIDFSPTGPLQAALDLSLIRDHLDTCTWFVNDLIWTYQVKEVLFVEPLRLRLPDVSYVNITYVGIPLAETMKIRPRDLAILQRVWIPRRLLQERIEQDSSA